MVKRHTANALYIAKCMGRKGYALEGSVKDPNDPNQWLEFGGQDLSDAPAGLPIGQHLGTSVATNVGSGVADAFKLGHQAYEGELPPNYFQTDEGIGRAFNAAATPMLGSFALSHAIGPAVQSGETMLGMAVKPKGGNWLDQTVTKKTQNLKGFKTPEELLAENEHYALEASDPVKYPQQAAAASRMIHRNNQDIALDKWVDAKLNRYIKNEMGTPEDPVRALAERGVLHLNEDQMLLGPTRAGRAREDQTLLGQSPLARAWEQTSDEMITTGRRDEHFDPYYLEQHINNPNSLLDDSASTFGQKAGRLHSENLAKYPWLEKIPPEAPVYSARSYNAGSFNRYLGFDHLRDELFNATRLDSDLPAHLQLSPDKLDKVSVPQAVELVSKINKWREDAAAKALAANATNEATHLIKEYPDQGYRWVELKAPTTVSDKVLEALSPEEKAKYQRFIKQGYGPTKALQALTGDIDNPALKAALKYEGDMMGHCVGGYCEDVELGQSQIFSLRDSKNRPHVTIEANPKEQSIIQVKGKGNAAPNAEYLPFVQDFIKSREWQEIGDIGNTGLFDVTSGASQSSLFAKILANKNITNPIDYLGEVQRKLMNGPRYVTEQEIDSLVSGKPLARASGGRTGHDCGCNDHRSDRSGYLAGGMPEVIDLETEVPDDTSSFDSFDDSPANFFRQDKELQQSRPEMFQQKTYKPYTAWEDEPTAAPARQPMAYAPSDTSSRGPAMDAISGATDSDRPTPTRPIPPGNIPNVPQAKNVDPRLFNILNAAGKNLPEGWSWNVTPSGGFRPGDPRFHGKGMAVDVQLVDDQGKALPNYQNAAAFRAYEQFAQAARKAQLDLHPELSSQLRWGGYFSGPVGKYGAKDLMHFDLGGDRIPMGGGSWDTGLHERERRYLPGAKSVGMGNYAKGGSIADRAIMVMSRQAQSQRGRP